jgi:HemX protein
MDRLLLVLSSLCFLAGFAYTLYGVRIGRGPRGNVSFLAMGLGFMFQTGFLFRRGESLGRCPLTNLFEVLIFLSWSIVLLYLVVGAAYRLSPLGSFTAPLVLVFQTFAMIAPIDERHEIPVALSPWIEFHAAVAIIAYGAFALAGIAGVTYLVQERQLKTHRLRSIFFHLPPIMHLAVATKRLIAVGFILLSAGLLAGFWAGIPNNPLKLFWAVGVWVLYASLLQAEWWKQLSPKRVALMSVLAFAISVSSLWWVHSVADKVH